MPKAKLIFHLKRIFDNGSISEIKLWQVPSPVCGSGHTFKYSLFYGRPGERWIGYDNEAGKGDRRHYADEEGDDIFTSPEQLMADFLADVAAWQKTKGAGK